VGRIAVGRGKGRKFVYYLIVSISLLIFLSQYLFLQTLSEFIARENNIRLLASRPDCSSLPKRALIADSLSIDYPNEPLIQRLSDLLRRAGYSVDVKRGVEVTLELYSRLNEYPIVILRTHGGKADVIVGGRDIKINGLFTGLEWRDEYMGFKVNGTGTRAFPYNSTKAYLAVLPKFFYEKLEGLFCRGSVVIVASCYSLYTRDIADVLAMKGLTYYIGFESVVSLDYMDKVLEKILNLVLIEDHTWENAASKVLEELGPDPIIGEYMKVIHYSGP
jgi:hypothetical protein